MEGDDKQAVEVRSLNRLLNRIRVTHMEPIKRDIYTMKSTLEEHMTEEQLTLAQIAGALKVLKWIGIVALVALTVQGVPIARIMLEHLK